MKDGIVTTPYAELYLSSATATDATILSVRTEVGNSIGTAVVRYELLHGESGMASVGEHARIAIGGTTVFRGSVGYSELVVEDGDDYNEIMLVDDRFLMQALTVGQPDIGTNEDGSGFSDVGWDIVFNADGVPNKAPDELDFNTGSNAESWTLRSILEMVCEFWLDDTISLNAGSLPDVFDSIPTSVSMTGMTGLQAVDSVFQLAGTDWCLDYGSSGSQVEACPGSIGRTIYLGAPKGGTTAESLSYTDAGDCRFRNRVLDSFDRVHAVSGPVVVETTYNTANGLLVKDAAFKDKQYALRFKVDVTQYAGNGLGQSLSAGSKPKPWLQQLVTRMSDDGDSYLSVSAMSALAALDSARPEYKLWITDGDDRWLLTGKFAIDADNGYILMESSVEVAASNGTSTTLALTDERQASMEVAFTVATLTDMRREFSTASSGSYLPDHHHRMIEVTSLTPEVRINSYLPDLDSDEPGASVQVASSAEDYVSVDDRLEEAAEAELTASPKVENSGRVELPFMPVLSVGNTVGFSGRATGMSNVYVRSIDYYVHREYSTIITVGNVAASRPSRDFAGVQKRSKSFDLGGLADLGGISDLGGVGSLGGVPSLGGVGRLRA
jgi:hypothetical protein